MAVEVRINQPGKRGPIGHAISLSAGMHYDEHEGRYKWFRARKFADLSWSDIQRWMDDHMTEAEQTGFRRMLKFYKAQFKEARAAHKIGWITTNIYWPRGLAEHLMHDFPQEFHDEHASSANAITRNFERILGPFIICGKYRPMENS